jgi:hypothetical protein
MIMGTPASDELDGVLVDAGAQAVLMRRLEAVIGVWSMP